MKTYKETKEALKLEEGKARSFSRDAYNELTKAYLNDPQDHIDYNSKGEETGTHNGAKSLREGLLTNLIKKVGLEEEEAREIATSYEVSKKEASAFYDIASDTIIGIMETGRAFTFNNESDLQAKLLLEDQSAGTDTKVTSMGTFNITKQAHRKMKVKSTCPNHLKDSSRVEK